MAKKLKLAEGISKPLVINSDYSRKTDVILTKDGTSSGKQLFFGIRKNNSIDNDLGDNYYDQLRPDPQVDGCSGQLTQSSYSNGRTIVYSLSENTTGSTRLIAFKYKDTVLFKINQTAKQETPKPQEPEILVYILMYKPTALQILSVYSEDHPDSRYNIPPFTEYEQCKMTFTLEEKNKYVCVYYSAKDIIHNNKTLNQLIQDGVLTYKSGIQIHSNFGNSIIKQWPKQVKINNNTSKISIINEKTKMYVYNETSNDTYVRESDNILCFEKGGIYKYKRT